MKKDMYININIKISTLQNWSITDNILRLGNMIRISMHLNFINLIYNVCPENVQSLLI